MYRTKILTNVEYMSEEDRRCFRNLLEDCEYAYIFDENEYIDFSDGKVVIGAYDNFGNMIGFTSLEDECDQLYISLVFVDAAYRKKGVGSLLLDKVQQYATKNGYGNYYLVVDAKNLDARNLYLKKNFICTKSNDNCVSYFMYKYSNDFIQSLGYFLKETFEIDNADNSLKFNIDKAKLLKIGDEIQVNDILSSHEFLICQKILSKIKFDDLNENVLSYFKFVGTNRDYENYCKNKLTDILPQLNQFSHEELNLAFLPLSAFYHYLNEEKMKLLVTNNDRSI